MNRIFRAAVAVLIFAVGFAGPGAAGPFEDASAAAEKGDYAEALRLMRPLAEQGLATAQNYLGIMYEWGWGVPQNDAAAASWFRKAADQGDAHAQYNLGLMYRNGYGVSLDYSAALFWYRKAADQSNASAQIALGDMYAFGYGVSRDYAAAVSWYRKAADQGDAAAQSALAKMYRPWRPKGLCGRDQLGSKSRRPGRRLNSKLYRVLRLS
jgi:TPR repeat protein